MTLFCSTSKNEWHTWSLLANELQESQLELLFWLESQLLSAGVSSCRGQQPQLTGCSKLQGSYYCPIANTQEKRNPWINDISSLRRRPPNEVSLQYHRSHFSRSLCSVDPVRWAELGLGTCRLGPERWPDVWDGNQWLFHSPAAVCRCFPDCNRPEPPPPCPSEAGPAAVSSWGQSRRGGGGGRRSKNVQGGSGGMIVICSLLQLFCQQLLSKNVQGTVKLL